MRKSPDWRILALSFALDRRFILLNWNTSPSHYSGTHRAMTWIFQTLAHFIYFIARSIQLKDSVRGDLIILMNTKINIVTCIFNECSWFIIAHEEEIWDPTPNKIFRRINSFANQSIIDIMILSRGLKTCWPGEFWIQSQAFIHALEYYLPTINVALGQKMYIGRVAPGTKGTYTGQPSASVV